MNIPGQLQQIIFLFADNRLITILEKMTTSSMTNVECYCISGHKSAHHCTKRRSTSTQQNMEVVRNQDPRVALSLGFLKDDGQTFKKGSAILIVPKDFSAFNSPGHDVLEEAGGV